jgi:hypothetical protein
MRVTQISQRGAERLAAMYARQCTLGNVRSLKPLL